MTQESMPLNIIYQRFNVHILFYLLDVVLAQKPENVYTINYKIAVEIDKCCQRVLSNPYKMGNLKQFPEHKPTQVAVNFDQIEILTWDLIKSRRGNPKGRGLERTGWRSDEHLIELQAFASSQGSFILES